MTGTSNDFELLFAENNAAIEFMAHNVNNKRLIELFLFGTPKKLRRELWRKSNICLPASQQIQLDFEKPIFTDKQQAVNYGRFLPTGYHIIKAYAFDLAIESKDNQLYLRQNQLQFDMLHGFYPSTTDLRVYIKNPEFDEELLQQESNNVSASVM